MSDLEERVSKLEAEKRQLLDHVTALQERCGELLAQRRGLRYLVHEFRDAMGLPVNVGPASEDVPAEQLHLCYRLVVEEVFETIRAGLQGHRALPAGTLADLERGLQEWVAMASPRIDMPAVADGLADVAYVVEGLCLLLGVDSWEVLCEVHAANMRKLGGPKRADGKQLKPEGWRPPDVAGLLRRLGWRPPQSALRTAG